MGADRARAIIPQLTPWLTCEPLNFFFKSYERKQLRLTEEKTASSTSASTCTSGCTDSSTAGRRIKERRRCLIRAWRLILALVLCCAWCPLESRRENGLWYKCGCSYQQSYRLVLICAERLEQKTTSGMSGVARTSGRTTCKNAPMT